MARSKTSTRLVCYRLPTLLVYRELARETVAYPFFL
jgi:hypothetical protein